MVAIIISLLVVVISFNFFMMSYQINGINRLVMSVPISLYETAINVFEIDEEIGPCFNKKILEEIAKVVVIDETKPQDDKERYKIAKMIGMDVFELNSPEEIDKQIEELEKQNYKTIYPHNNKSLNAM